MRATIAVHGRFHAFDLARQLSSRGVEVTLMTTYPAFVARGMVPRAVRLRTAPWLEALRRLTQLARVLPQFDVAISRAFSAFAARRLPKDTDILIGWSGASLDAIKVAKARGLPVILERGSSHIAHQARILSDEFRRHGLPGAPVDSRLIEIETEEYSRADFIAVPTSYAAATFVRCGVPREKLFVNPYGVDLERFAATPIAAGIRNGPLRVLFVGQIGLRKGVPSLLRAAEQLGEQVELHLVGPIEPYMRPILQRHRRDRVIVHGPLRSPNLETAFGAAQVFCLPSLEEGLPLALLQAMAAGLPAVATPETGAEDVMTNGVEGFIVPSNDSGALASAFDRLRDGDRRRTMGRAARGRVATGLTWDDYGQRAMSFLNRLAVRPV